MFLIQYLKKKNIIFYRKDQWHLQTQKCNICKYLCSVKLATNIDQCYADNKGLCKKVKNVVSHTSAYIHTH